MFSDAIVQEWESLRASLPEPLYEHPLEQGIIALGEQLTDDQFAGECYAALCNTAWTDDAGQVYTCSWRYAGGLIAAARNRHRGDDQEDYLSFYCSGDEGQISDRAAEAFAAIGYQQTAYPD